MINARFGCQDQFAPCLNRIRKNLSFCKLQLGTEKPGFPDLQKYIAKVFYFARTFANESTKGKAAIMKVGYARVSTEDQNLDLQLQALKKAGCTKLFKEKLSGANRHRPEFQKLLEQLRSGDTVIVWKLDRLARSTKDLLETMELLQEQNVKFQSLSEPWANTTSHAGKMIMTVFAGIAEFERELIRERTSAGQRAARKRGVKFGRPVKLNGEQKQLAQRLLDEGKSVSQVANAFGVHVTTIYRLER